MSESEVPEGTSPAGWSGGSTTSDPAPVAMVTGGNRGIGLGITRELLGLGYAVSILATRPEPTDLLDELRELPGGSGLVHYHQGSVADLETADEYVADTVDAFGRVDVLVNNAGVAPQVRADILEAAPESFDRVLGINLRGPYFLTQRVARALIEQRDRELAARDAAADGAPDAATPATTASEQRTASVGAGVPSRGQVWGTIVNMSSISADTVSLNRGEYCISKAGVHMATLLWAARLAPEGILVYEVRPGVIATDMTAGVKDRYDQVFAEGGAPIPRWGTPADVGSTVGMLVQRRAPYSTGDVINVDGGMHIPVL